MTKPSRVLEVHVDDTRPVGIDRKGAIVRTDAESIVELSGGSHASCIVNDNGEILHSISEACRAGYLTGAGRHYAHQVQLELADTILNDFVDDLAKVFFTSGGTEAFETALRLAFHLQESRGHSRKQTIIGHKSSYYGMSVAARNAASHPIHSINKGKLHFGWPKLPEPTDENIPKMQQVLSDNSKHTAAVVLEPVAGTTGGARVVSDKYLSALSSECKRIGALLILDETVTAFGRTGKTFHGGHIRPDILFGGKCLGAAFVPIGCVVVSGTMCDEFRLNGNPLPLRLTFSGNPLACTVALIVQNYIRANNIQDRVRENSERIEKHLKGLIKRHDSEIGVTGVGHLWGLHRSLFKGTAGASLENLKRIASRRGIEFMGGVRKFENLESVHMMITPAFDLTDRQLFDLLDCGFRLFLDATVTCDQSMKR